MTPELLPLKDSGRLIVAPACGRQQNQSPLSPALADRMVGNPETVSNSLRPELSSLNNRFVYGFSLLAETGMRMVNVGLSQIVHTEVTKH
jgi:hypothetical protein